MSITSNDTPIEDILLMIETQLKQNTDDCVEEIYSNSSKDNNFRKELLWEKREELVLKKWVENMRVQAKKHYIAGKKFKKIHEILMFPSIIIPVICSGLSPILQPYIYVSTGLMLSIGILNGISGFLNPSSKKEKHLSYVGLYNELVLDIEKELCKPKTMRIACDVYLEHISLKEINLDLSAPLL